ncbi:MAG: hypothetical protein ABSG16_23640, partial [Candidatus Acidiferrum sp.]
NVLCFLVLAWLDPIVGNKLTRMKITNIYEAREQRKSSSETVPGFRVKKSVLAEKIKKNAKKGKD